MSSTTHEKKNKGAAAMTTAVDDLKSLVRDAETVLANAGDAAGDQVADLQSRMRDALESSRASLHDLKASALEHIDECDQYMRTHPYQSIGVAVAVGALVGIMLGRRSS